MTAVVYRDSQSGFHRAVCKDERCRQDNAQRTYWRTSHLERDAAVKAGRAHDREQHPDAHAGGFELENQLRRRPPRIFDEDGELMLP